MPGVSLIPPICLSVPPRCGTDTQRAPELFSKQQAAKLTFGCLFIV